MSDRSDTFHEMKTFLRFDETDVANLVSLGPIFAKHGAAITDSFYELLGHFPQTAGLIEGRVNVLKATHHQWMAGLFCGDYGDEYFNNRLKIGQTHVRVGLDPRYVEGVMSILRAAGIDAMRMEIDDIVDCTTRYKSLLKVLDLDLMIINFAYAEERLDRLTGFTGMSRKLIENVIKRAAKS